MEDGEFRNYISELKSRADIVSVISKYVQVSRRGRNFWACCPFHMEREPSFCIYEEDQSYHCYGCKEHGDAIRFVMKMENVEYLPAVEILAKSVNMPVPNFSNRNEADVEIIKNTKDQILKALRLAKEHYKENLYMPSSKVAQEYIKKRKLGKHDLEDFEIGYSLGSDEIISFLKSNNISIGIMEKAGLISKSEKGTYYDFFTRRLMFPLFDIYGDCIGFSGRILIDDKLRAKYKNSPTTLVFDKSKTMFGLNLVKKYKRTEKFNNIIIVEGQMDVIAMHRAGFKNTVACLGTAFTSSHAKILHSLTDNVVICLDGDSAGLKAANRIIDVLSGEDINITCVTIPNGLDPDEYINNFGKEAMQKLLSSAVNYIDFQIDYLARGQDLSKKEAKSKFVSRVMNILAKLPTFAQRQIYLGHISDLSGIPIEVLQKDAFNIGEEKQEERQEETKIELSSEDATNRAIKFILVSMLKKQEYAFKKDISRFLINNSYQKLYNLIIDRKNKGETLTISQINQEFDLNNEPNILDIVNYNFNENGNNEKYYYECLWTLYEKELKIKQNALNERYNASKDLNERKNILVEITEISKKLKTKNMEE